jgi:hypothetical protein
MDNEQYTELINHINSVKNNTADTTGDLDTSGNNLDKSDTSGNTAIDSSKKSHDNRNRPSKRKSKKQNIEVNEINKYDAILLTIVCTSLLYVKGLMSGEANDVYYIPYLVISLAIIGPVWYMAENWTAIYAQITEYLSYVYSCLTELLNYMYSLIPTLNLRVAEYHNLDNYLELFQTICGLYHIGAYVLTKSLTYKLLGLQGAVLAFQILKWAYYNIYPTFIKFIYEYLYPILAEYFEQFVTITVLILNIIWVNVKLMVTGINYLFNLAYIFYVPIAVTIVVIVVC